MARGGRLPRIAGRPPRFLRTGHRRAISLSEAHLQPARRDAGHTLGREAEGIRQSLWFHRASRGLRAQRATFRVLAEGDPDVDATLASAVGCPPPPRSLTPPPATALRPDGPCCAKVRRCTDCPIAVTRRACSGPHITAASRVEQSRPWIGMSLVPVGDRSSARFGGRLRSSSPWDQHRRPARTIVDPGASTKAASTRCAFVAISATLAKDGSRPAFALARVSSADANVVAPCVREQSRHRRVLGDGAAAPLVM